MKHLKSIISVLFLISPFAANADAVSLSETGALTTEGGSISLAFSGLSESDGTDGTITLANEAGSTFDLFMSFENRFVEGLIKYGTIYPARRM